MREKTETMTLVAGRTFQTAVLALSWLWLSFDSNLPANAEDWSVDVRTGELSDQGLVDVLNQFQEAAKKSPVARQAELEKCYRRCRSQYPDALENDVIYVCQLMAAHRNAQAKSHLDQKSKKEFAAYWPTRRLTIYLHATTDTVPAIAKQLKAFSSDLTSKEHRPEVLEFNAQWLGQALEGLQLSAPDNAEVAQIIDGCEEQLKDHIDAFRAGRQAAADLAQNLAPAKQANAATIEEGKQEVQKEIDRTEDAISAKKAELQQAKQTIDAARPTYEQAAAPLQRTMTFLAPQIQSAAQEVARAEQDYAGETKGNQGDRERARQKLLQAQQKCSRLQGEYSSAEQKYQEICTEFNQKYATELAIVGIVPKDLRIKGTGQKQNVKARDRLNQKQHATLAFRAVDFLRPDPNRILSDLADRVEQK